MDLFAPTHLVRYGNNKVLGLRNCGGNYLTRSEWYASDGNAAGQVYFGGAVHGAGGEPFGTFSSQGFTPCDPACPGWVLSIVDRDPGYVVEKCDDCGLFSDDDEARAAYLLDLEFEVPQAKAAGRRLIGLEKRDELWLCRLQRLCKDPAVEYDNLRQAADKLEALLLRIGINF